MTTMTKTKASVPAALIANAQAVVANPKSSKAKVIEAKAVLKRAGVAVEKPTIATAKTFKQANAAFTAAVLTEGAALAEASLPKAVVFDQTMADSVRHDWPALELGDMTPREKREEFEAANAKPETIVNPDAPAIVQALQATAEAGVLKEFVNAMWPSETELPPVTDDEMLMALAIIERATKQQAEALRKASAERKKVAPEGPKIVKAKALTAEQQARADAKAKELARLSNVIGLIGTGRIKEMATAVSGIKTPDVKLIIKHHNPAFKLTGVKVPELRAELMGYAGKEHAKTA
jgi:hypothetical protein